MNDDAVQPKKIGSTRRSWLIIKGSWRIMKLDKEVVVVPLITGILGIIIAVIGFGAGFLLSHNWDYYFNSAVSTYTSPNSSGWHFNHLTYAVWLVTSALLAIVSTFTLAAMVAMSLKRLRGGDPVLGDGLDAIKKNFKSLTLFALFSFGIVQILNWLQSRLPFAGKLLAFLGQLAWRVAAFFAVPIIVDAD